MFVMLLSDKGNMHVNYYLAKNVHNIVYLYFFLGLDYISQEDILPYMVSDAFSRPIHHELFDRFLYPEPGRGTV